MPKAKKGKSGFGKMAKKQVSEISGYLKKVLKGKGALVALAAVLVAVFVFPLPRPSLTEQGWSVSFSTPLFMKYFSFGQLSEEQIGQKVIGYINDNLVQSGEATLVRVEDLGGVYRVVTSYQEREIPVYVTKDGKNMFLQRFDLTQQLQQTQPQQQQAPPEVQKSDKPEAHAFVMSFCPYGLQFLKAYIPVIELLGDKADLRVNFVSYIMHGEKELAGNNKMYCVQRDAKDKFAAYLRCFVESGNPDACIESAGIDKSQIDSCISEIDEQYNITGLYNDKSTWSGGRFPQYPVEAQLNARYGVRGSPTFVLNGQVVNVNRSPESIKEAICAAFNNPPEECNQTLSTSAASPGLGPVGAAASGSESGTAQCG